MRLDSPVIIAQDDAELSGSSSECGWSSDSLEKA